MPELQNIIIAWAGNEILALRYESSEACLVHIDDALKKYQAVHAAYLTDSAVWHRKMRDSVSDSRDIRLLAERQLKKKKSAKYLEVEQRVKKLNEQFEALRLEQPKRPDSNFLIGGVQFDLENCFYDNYDGKGRSISLPEVYTVQEWFEMKLAEDLYVPPRQIQVN